MADINSENRQQDKILFILYLCWAVCIPWSLFLMQVLLGIIIVFTVITGIMQKKPLITVDSFLIIVLLYLVYRTLSAIFSPDVPRSLVSILDNEWVLASIFVLASNKISPEYRQKIFAGLILSATIAGVYGIFQGFTGMYFHVDRQHGPLGSYYRAIGGYGFYLSFAGNQMMIVFLTFAMLVSSASKDRFKRMLYVAALLIILGSIVFTFARSTWLALILFFVIMGAVVNKKWFFRVTVPAVSLCLILILFIPELRNRFASIFDAAQNATRLNLWHTSWQMIMDKPLFGIGPGLFRELISVYQVPGYYDTLAHSHNDFLYVAAMSGIPALILWLAIWIAWLYYLFRYVKEKNSHFTDKNLLIYISLAIGSILFAGLFQCYYTDLENTILWIFLMVHGYQIMREGGVFKNYLSSKVD